MNRVPMLIVRNSSCRSLVSQISFDDDSIMSSSTTDSAISSSKRACKWCSGPELCTPGLESTPRDARSERRCSTEPIPKPVRKGSTDELFDLSIAEARSLALKKAMMDCRTQIQQQQRDSPIDKFWSTKQSSLKRQPATLGSSRGKMANAQWDLTPKTPNGALKRNSRWEFPDNDSGPSLGTLLSTIASSSGSSSGGRRDRHVIKTDVSMIVTRRSSKTDYSKLRPTFSRISMDGSIDEGSVDLRKPSRAYALNSSNSGDLGNPAPTVHGSSSSPSISKNKKNSFVSPRRVSCHHSTMPLTMPVRKTSTQDLLNLPASGSSSHALRSKLSRSKLHSAGSFHRLVPRRIGSASSMVRNQSRECLRRHG